MTQSLIDYLNYEWSLVHSIAGNNTTFDDCCWYWDMEDQFSGLPILHMAKLSQLSRQQKLLHIVEALTHPLLDVLRDKWTSVVIPGNDPQRDIDIFDWLFQRGHMNVDWVRLYLYANSGSFDGSEYFFRDKAMALLFKLSWVGL